MMRRAHAAFVVLKGDRMGTEKLAPALELILCELGLVPKYTALGALFLICKMKGLN